MRAETLDSLPTLGWWERVAALFRGQDAGAQPIEAHPADLKDLDSLGKHLKYHQYDPDRELFVNTDAIGFALEVAPQTGADEAMEARMKTLFSVLPPATCFQWTMFADAVDTERLDAYTDLRRIAMDRDASNDVFMTMAEQRADYFKGKKGKPLFPTTNYSIKHLRLCLSISRTPKRVDTEAMDAMLALKKSVVTTLATANLPAAVMDAQRFLRFVKPMTDPRLLFESGSGAETDYDEGKSLGAQVGAIGMPVAIDSDGGGLTWGFASDLPATRIRARTYCVSDYPKSKALWEMGNLIGAYLDDNLQYPGPFVITLGGRTLEAASVNEVSNYKNVRAEQAMGSKFARVQPDIKKIASDNQFIADHVATGGRQVDLYHVVTVFTQGQRSEGVDQTVKNIWQGEQFGLDAARGIQFPLFVSCLPMTLTNDACDGLRAAKVLTRKTDQNAVSLAPVIGEWTGTQGEPVLWYLGKRGNPVFVDIFDNDQGNYNVLLSGTSGSGKTVKLNDLIVGYASMGALVRVVDSKRGFQNLAKTCGGTYMRFQADRMPNINPFTNLKTLHDLPLEDEMNSVKPLMLRMASPSATLPALHASFMERGVSVAWKKYGNEACPHAVADALREIKNEKGEPERVAHELAEMLFPYTRDGQYGRVVNGKATLEFDNQFVVLELEDLMNHPDFKRVVMYSVTARSLQEMHSLPRSLRKIFAIDEGWQHLSVNDKDEDAAKFLEYNARLARSYEGSQMISTQGIDDCLNSVAGRAIFDNSDWKFLGRQSKETITSLSQKGELPFPPAVEKMLLALTKTDWYSEWLIRSPIGSSVVRFVADPWFLTMCHSKGPVFEQVQQLIAAGMPTEDAITHVTELRMQHA
jgi:conjugal transfer ATP-binding protein TraC